MAAFRFHIQNDLGDIRKMVYSNVRDEAHARSILALHQSLDKNRPQFNKNGTPKFRTAPGNVVKVEPLAVAQNPASLPSLSTE
jgi:hypothetical protein